MPLTADLGEWSKTICNFHDGNFIHTHPYKALSGTHQISELTVAQAPAGLWYIGLCGTLDYKTCARHGETMDSMQAG